MADKRTRAFSDIESELDKQNDEALDRIKSLGRYVTDIFSKNKAIPNRINNSDDSDEEPLETYKEINSADLKKAKDRSQVIMPDPQTELMRGMQEEARMKAETRLVPDEVIKNIEARRKRQAMPEADEDMTPEQVEALKSRLSATSPNKGDLLEDEDMPLKLQPSRFKKLFSK